MTKTFVFSVGVVTFLALAWFCIHRRAPIIEADVKSLAQARLFADGLDTVQVRASGRTVTLDGVVAHEGERKLAIAGVAGVRGVGKVVDDLELLNSRAANAGIAEAELDRSYQFWMQFDGETLRFEGTIPEDATARTLDEVARDSGFKQTDLEKLETRANPPQHWTSDISTMIRALAHLERGEALLAEDRWQLIGAAAHAGKRRQAEISLEFLKGGTEGQCRIDLLISKPGLVCQENIEKLLAEGELEFEDGFSALTDQGDQTVRSLFQQAQECHGMQFQVIAISLFNHLAPGEMKITQIMAKTIRDELVALGMAPGRISSMGLGTPYPAHFAQSSEDDSERLIYIDVMENSP